MRGSSNRRSSGTVVQAAALGVIAVACCAACGASPRHHVAFSGWKGGAMRGLDASMRWAAVEKPRRDDARQASSEPVERAGGE